MGQNLGFDVNPGGTRLVIGQVVFVFVAWVVCLLRAYVKFFMQRRVLLDDWFMFASLIVYTAYGIIAVHGVAAGGTGKHTEDLTPEGIEVALRAWYLCEVIYAPLSALIRTSIAVFILRLATKSWQKWIIWVNIAIIWLTSVVYFFLMTLQCLPSNYFWQGPVAVPGVTGSCMDHDVVPIATIVHSSVSAVSDWVLGLLPVAMLWKVNINRRTKISIAILLGMGLVAGVALIIRIPYVKRIAISADFLYDTVSLAAWSVIEPSLGIVAGSIAAIRPLFKAWGFGLNRSRRSNFGGHSGKQRGGPGGVVNRWRASRSLRGLPRPNNSGIGPCGSGGQAGAHHRETLGSGMSFTSEQALKTYEAISSRRHTMETLDMVDRDIESSLGSPDQRPRTGSWATNL